MKRRKRMALMLISAVLGVALGSGAFFMLTEEKPPRAALSPTDKEQRSAMLSRDGFLYKETEGGLILSSTLSTIPEKVIIPDNIDGVPVVSVGVAAFHDRSIKEVYIPDSVKSIEWYAFARCAELSSVRFPTQLEVIGASAFSNCPALESVELPDSITSIGEDAFKYCTSLKNVNIPTGLTVIEQGLFDECPIESITFHEGLKAIGDYAFSGCKFKSIVLPESVTYISNGTFNHYDGAFTVYAPRERIYYGLAGNDGSYKWVLTD